MYAPASIIFILAFCAALVSFISQRRHILMCLLSLEACMLSLALLISYSFSASSSMELFYCLTVLTFGACEASVALATLVFMSRTFGSDMLSTLTINKC